MTTIPCDVTTLPDVIGTELVVPLVDGGWVDHANLDHAATTPCLREVWAAVNELLPWYASVHRGAGFASRVCSQVYESARASVRRFAGLDPRAVVLFTRNTTDAFNLLAGAIPASTTVLRFDTEHHAALLPWRGVVERLGVPRSPADAVRRLAAGLARAGTGPRLVVVSGAANVTGEVWPVAELAETARRHGARTVLDAAQLASHRRLTAAEWGVDWVVFSGHKIYAPFGAGVLAGSPDWLGQAAPYLAGGGAARLVSGRDGALAVSWNGLPARHEAGSPNLLGVRALAAACDALTATGWDVLGAHEHELLVRLCDGLAAVPDVCPVAFWSGHGDRAGICSFTLRGRLHPELADPACLAAVLSAEYGVSVRAGGFCAHLGTRAALRAGGVNGATAVRASVGLGSRVEHVDRLVSAVAELAVNGPKWTYEHTADGWTPVPDRRPVPGFARDRAEVGGRG